MLEPSLFLLAAKTFSIFAISWVFGWSLCWKRPHEDSWVSWVVLTVVGVAALNLMATSAIAFGLPGGAGLLVLLAILLARIIKTFIEKNRPALPPLTWLFSAFLICGLVVANYLAPLWVEGTSGLISRGGADHSTYLSLSDYFLNHSLWDTVDRAKTFPPEPYWEANLFPYNIQKWGDWWRLYTVHVVPIGNQLIATPFMQMLPGELDETYTAAVAFYSSMSAASVIALVRALFGEWKGMKWIAFVPLALSNLLIFPSGTQSIPFVFAISMLNVGLLLAWHLTKEPVVKARAASYVPAVVCGGGLLTIYPHLFLAEILLMGAIALSSLNRERIKNYFYFGVVILSGSMLLSHFYLMINFPLIIKGITISNTLYRPFSLLQVLSTQSGLIDFMSLSTGKVMPFLELVSIVVFACCLFLALFGLSRHNRYPIYIMLVLLGVFWTGTVYYNLKVGGSGGYQMVRLATLSHLYVLGVAGLGLVRMLSGSLWPRRLAFVFVVVFAVLSVSQRMPAVAEIVNVPHAFGTEIRDADSYRIRARLYDIQQDSAARGKDRIVYYFGHADGVDFGGSTVFMRRLFALDAFNLESRLRESSEGKNIWSPSFLNGALLMLSPPDQNEIIYDNRKTAASRPFISSKRTVVWDTASQDVAAVIGEGWNYPLSYTFDSQVTSFRYLRGRTAALTIWSAKPGRVRLSFRLAADAQDSRLLFHDIQSGYNDELPVEFWSGNYERATVYQVEVDLQAGPNIFEMTPLRDGSPAPWLLVFKIKIDDVD